ncbi:MAG: VPLPA-CTERM sorting domain-containing protein [Pseudomonadota bacterium]
MKRYAIAVASAFCLISFAERADAVAVNGDYSVFFQPTIVTGLDDDGGEGEIFAFTDIDGDAASSTAEVFIVEPGDVPQGEPPSFTSTGSVEASAGFQSSTAIAEASTSFEWFFENTLDEELQLVYEYSYAYSYELLPTTSLDSVGELILSIEFGLLNDDGNPTSILEDFSETVLFDEEPDGIDFDFSDGQSGLVLTLQPGETATFVANFDLSATATTVPLPAGMALLLASLGGLVLLRRREA